MKSLQHVLQKAHAAILHRADGAAHPSRVGGAVMHPEVIVDPACGTGSMPGGSRGGEPTCQPLKVPVPTVRVVVAAPPTAVKEKPTCAPVADLTVGLTLSRGAARLFALLHEAACEVVAKRAYTALPDAVTFHDRLVERQFGEVHRQAPHHPTGQHHPRGDVQHEIDPTDPVRQRQTGRINLHPSTFRPILWCGNLR